MSIIIRLQNLPWSASSVDIRTFFVGLSIPVGGVHIVGGELGEAFIVFSTDEDARLAMERNGGSIKDMKVKLLLSSRTEMARVIEQARSQTSQVLPPNIPMAMKAAAMSDSDRRPTEERLIREKKLIAVKEYDLPTSRSPAPAVQFEHSKPEIRSSVGSPVPRDVNYMIPRSAATADELIHERKYLGSRDVPKSVEMHLASDLHPRVGSTPGLSYGPKQPDGGSIPQDYVRVQTQRVSEAPYLFPAAMHSASLKTEAKMVVEQPRLPSSFVTSNRYPAYANVASGARQRAPPVAAAVDAADIGLVPVSSKNRRQPSHEYAVPDDGAAYPRGYANAPSDLTMQHDIQNTRMIVSRSQRTPETNRQFIHDSELLHHNQVSAYQPSTSKHAPVDSADHEVRYYEGRPSPQSSNRLEAPNRPTQPEMSRGYPVVTRQPIARQSRFQPEQELGGEIDRQREHRAYFAQGDGDERYKSSGAYPEETDFDASGPGYAESDLPRKIPRRPPMDDRYESEEARWPTASVSPAWNEGRHGYQDRPVMKNQEVDDYSEEPMDVEMSPVARHPTSSQPDQSDRYYQKPDNQPGGFDNYHNRNRREPVIDERRMDRPESRNIESRSFPSRKRGFDNQNDETLDRQLVKSSRSTAPLEPSLENRPRTRNFQSTRWGPERETPTTRDRFENRHKRGPEPDDRITHPPENQGDKQFPTHRWESDNQPKKPMDVPQNANFRAHTRGHDSRRFERSDQYSKREPVGQKSEAPYNLPDRMEQNSEQQRRREIGIPRQPEPSRPQFSPRRDQNAPPGRLQDKPRSREEPQNRRPPQLTVEVSGLPDDTREEDILNLFRDIVITSNNIRLMRDGNGRPTGTAFVKFKDHRDYDAGLRRSGRKIGNCFPEVKPCSLAAFEKCPSSPSVPPARKVESQTAAAPVQKVPSKEEPVKPKKEVDHKPKTEKSGESAPPKTASVKVEDVPEKLTKTNNQEAIPVPTPAATAPHVEKSRRSSPPRQESCDKDPCVEIQGLPYTCKEKDIAEFFSGLKIVHLHVDKLPDGRAAGSAYAEFATPAELQKALDLNGKRMSYRYITVTKITKEAMKKASQKKRPALLDTPPIPDQRMSDNRSLRDGPTFCAAVDGVPKNATNYDLESFFAEVSIVPIAIHVMKGPDKLPSGKAFVEFQERVHQEKSLVKNGNIMCDSRISVHPISYKEMCDFLGGRPNTVLPSNMPPANSGHSPQPSRRPPQPDHGKFDGPGDQMPPRQNRMPIGVPPGMRPRMPHGGMRPLRPDGPRGPPPRGPLNRLRGPPPGPMNGGGPMHQRPPSRFGRPEQPSNPGDFGAPGCVVSVSNLHFRAGLEDILGFFRDFRLSSDNVIRKYTNDGKPTGDARIAFRNHGEALRAVNEFNRLPIFGRPIHLSIL